MIVEIHDHNGSSIPVLDHKIMIVRMTIDFRGYCINEHHRNHLKMYWYMYVNHLESVYTCVCTQKRIDGRYCGWWHTLTSSGPLKLTGNRMPPVLTKRNRRHFASRLSQSGLRAQGLATSSQKLTNILYCAGNTNHKAWCVTTYGVLNPCPTAPVESSEKRTRTIRDRDLHRHPLQSVSAS